MGHFRKVKFTTFSGACGGLQVQYDTKYEFIRGFRERHEC